MTDLDITTDTPIRATHRGKLFDGLMDCYVLEDGRRVVSRRGVVRVLTSDGAEHGRLGRYIDRLPSEFAHLATEPNIRIRRPEGGIALAAEADWVIDLMQAYDELDDAGLLRRDQKHLARNARKFIRVAAKTGIVALIDEATGYQHQRAPDALQTYFGRLFRDEMAPWDKMFTDETVDELARVYGKRYHGGPHPRWMASVNKKLYDTFLGTEAYAEMKRRNPDPQFRANHHQLLTEEARAKFGDKLELVRVIAMNSVSRDHFWQQLDAWVHNRPMQLSMMRLFPR